MRNQRLPNYLRLHRKRLGLTQAEMAFLLGYKNSARVSRFERFQSQPNFVTAMQYETIFGVTIDTLFPGIAFHSRGVIRKRCLKLMVKLERANTPVALRKSQALGKLAEALKNR